VGLDPRLGEDGKAPDEVENRSDDQHPVILETDGRGPMALTGSRSRSSHVRPACATSWPRRSKRRQYVSSFYGVAELAAPRSTAGRYNNAIAFRRAFVPSGAQISAQTSPGHVRPRVRSEGAGVRVT
jgi:hypothetical protein